MDDHSLLILVLNLHLEASYLNDPQGAATGNWFNLKHFIIISFLVKIKAVKQWHHHHW